ncbi:MAG: hypothetical protein GXX04_07200 [Clostridiaceae bacterium]|nr:hypothetical protein [Clostridiaceae bacterium]
MDCPKRLFAAIDIGSHRLKMKIIEASPDGRIKDLETVDHLIPLGRDTFNEGKLSFESVKKTCEAIRGFRRLMADYGVQEWRAVATSAIREAANRDCMIDRIRHQTGFDVEIINNSQEKFLTYKAVKWQLENEGAMDTGEPTLILNIGAGNLLLHLMENGLLASSQNLKLGALRIKESIAKIEKHTLNFSRVLEEYIEAHIESVEYLKSSNEVKNFVVVSGELDFLANIAGPHACKKVVSLDKDLFESICSKAMNKTPRALEEEYDISLADAELFVPSLILIRKFLDKTCSDRIIIPCVSLVDGLIIDRFNCCDGMGFCMDFKADILSCVRKLAARYRSNEKHINYVEDAALRIFDRLTGIHGMGEKERFILQIASILHDVGKFIAADPHSVYSFNIINASQILGLSDDELRMTAFIARYHSLDAPDLESGELAELGTDESIKTMKLIAIIRMADAMDTSHKQKLKISSMDISEDQFIVRVESWEEAVLENWTFNMKSEFFSEVFGLNPQMVIKNRMVGGN